MMYTEHDGFLTRDGTTDANAVFALANDEYHLRDKTLTGWAIDVGAHIGTVALSLARQHPHLRVIAVEAVPDNSDILEQNIARMGLSDRVTSVRAWAGAPGQETGTVHYGYTHRAEEGDSYVSAHRFIGQTWRELAEPEFAVELPAVSLDSLLEQYGIDDLTLLKIDCEGGEWAFLNTPAIAKVETVAGEYHGGYPGTADYQPNPVAALDRLLGKTHRIKFWSQEPVIGLFEATRR